MLAITKMVSVSNFGTVIIGGDKFVSVPGDMGATGFQTFATPEADTVEVLVSASESFDGSAPVVTGTEDEWIESGIAVLPQD